MHPSKVDRACVHQLTDLPNIGKEMARDLRLLGIATPAQLKGRDPFDLYEALERASGTRQDPCVLDVFISITRFMNGEPPRTWWSYTVERKRLMAARST